MSDNRRRSGRIRHQVERFGYDNSLDMNGVDSLSSQVHGTPLGDFKAIEEKLEEHSSEDEVIKNLHMLLYNKVGTKNSRKDSIQKFDGFPEGGDQEILNSRIEKLCQNKKFSIEIFQSICAFFGIKPSDSKETIAKDIIDFVSARTAPVHSNGTTKEEATKTENEIEDGTPEKKRKRLSTDTAEEQKTVEKKRRHVTPLTRYSKTVISGVKKEHPKWKTKRINDYIKGKWNELSAEEKKKYEDVEDLTKENDQSENQQSDQSEKEQDSQSKSEEEDESEKQPNGELQTNEDDTKTLHIEKEHKKNEIQVQSENKDQSGNDKNNYNQPNNLNEKNETNQMDESESYNNSTEEQKTVQPEQSQNEPTQMEIQTENNEGTKNQKNDDNAEIPPKDVNVHVEKPADESNNKLEENHNNNNNNNNSNMDANIDVSHNA